MPGSPGKRAARRKAKAKLQRAYELQDAGVEDRRIPGRIGWPPQHLGVLLSILAERRRAGEDAERHTREMLQLRAGGMSPQEVSAVMTREYGYPEGAFVDILRDMDSKESA